jgi:hypothetical protein
MVVPVALTNTQTSPTPKPVSTPVLGLIEAIPSTVVFSVKVEELPTLHKTSESAPAGD